MDEKKDIEKKERRIRHLFRTRNFHIGVFFLAIALNVLSLIALVGVFVVSGDSRSTYIWEELFALNALKYSLLGLCLSGIVGLASFLGFSFLDKRLKEAKYEYWAQHVKYLQEKVCERMNITRCHVLPDSGVSRDEIIRSGMFEAGSTIHISSDAYLEGIMNGHRFRGSQVSIYQAPGMFVSDPCIPGYFWIISGLVECPGQMMIFSRNLAARMDMENSRNRWCGSNLSKMDLCTTENEQFNAVFRCYCNAPENAGEFLTEEMMEHLLAFAADHEDNGLFFGFNNRELNIFEVSFTDSKKQEFEDVDELMSKYARGRLRIADFSRSALNVELNKIRAEAGKKGKAETRHVLALFRAWNADSIMGGAMEQANDYEDALDKELEALRIELEGEKDA